MISEFAPINSKKSNNFLESTSNRGMTAFMMGNGRRDVVNNNASN